MAFTALAGIHAIGCVQENDPNDEAIQDTFVDPAEEDVGEAIGRLSNPIYDDVFQGWTYTGSWAAVNGIIGAVDGTLHWSNVTGAQATFTCAAGGSAAYGVAFDLIYSKAYNRGIATIWVTSSFYPGQVFGVQQVDMFDLGVSRQQRYEYSTDMPLGTGMPYVIHIKVSGAHNASSTGTFIDIDAIECDLN
jgi:hypothetical protein